MIIPSLFRRRTHFMGFTVLAAVAIACVWNLIPIQEKPPKQPNETFHAQRAFPGHDIPEGAYARALQQAREFAPAARTSPVPWQASGPTNVGGRITSIAVDPTDATRWYVGAADGGVLRTDNSGANWAPLMDDFGGLSIGDVAHHPVNPGEVIAGTGEANGSGDSYDGIGLVRTTDFGATWSVIGLEDTQRIARVVYDPVNPNVIHVAASGGLYSKGTNRGIYRSTDGGANWAQTLFVSDSTSAIDLTIDPTNVDVLYAAFWERLRGPDFRKVAGTSSRIWKTTDGGDTWAQLTNGLPTGSDVARIGLALAPSSPSTIYALYSDFNSGDGATRFDGLYRTTNAGSSWSRVDNGSDLSNLYSSFGWYFGQVRVSPTNSNVVYALGVSLYRSTNGGSSFSNVTGSQHVDFHDLWMNPANPSQVVTGNDGGVFESFTGTGSWAKKPDLPISQFYAITVDPQLPNRIYGGTQDNSTPRTLTGALDDWDILIGGDGFTVVVDPTDSNIIYGEFQFGGFRKSTDGFSFSDARNGISLSDRFNWHTPFVMDPNNRLTLYLGSHRVYRTTNGAASWSFISPDLTNGPGTGNLRFGTLTTLAVANTAPNTIYTGSDDGRVHVTTNGGSQWTSIDASLPVRYVTRVAIDPTDDATAYVTLSGYRLDETTPRVYRTTNWGGSWTPIANNLPDAPVNDIVVDALDTNRLFVATDVGVFVSNDLGGVWEKLGIGLPLSVVVDIELHQPTRSLVAGTHGRSSFRIDLDDVVDAPLAQDSFNGLAVHAPRPNPSSGRTELSFSLSRDAPVSLTIHDVTGRRIRTVFDGAGQRGENSFVWDGRDERGQVVASGVYFGRVTSSGRTKTARITRIQ